MTSFLAQVTPGEMDALLPYLAGPASAVIVLMLVLFGLYLIVVKHGVPLVGAIATRHLNQFDSLLQTQREEGKAIAKTLASIDRRLARLEGLSDTSSYTGQPLSPDRGV